MSNNVKSNKKHSVEYNTSEPKFIAQFKRRVGYKESESVDSKKSKIEKDFEDKGFKEDEMPQIVIPEGSDVSEKEVNKFVSDQIEDERADRAEMSKKKILFKKPDKAKLKEANEEGKSKSSKSSSTTPTQAKPSLLSFNDTDEDDHD